jgi:maltose O-acetyltransferase
MIDRLRKAYARPILVSLNGRRWASAIRRFHLSLQARLYGGETTIHPSVSIERPVKFQGAGHLLIDEGVKLGYLFAGAEGQTILLQPREAGSMICIGRDSSVMNGCELMARESIRIGRNCLIGPKTIIVDSDFHGIAPEERHLPGKTVPVVIEDNVWIGMSAILLKGARIGRNAIVGSGCVVTGEVPPDSIIVGNPSRSIGSVHRTRER